MNETTLSQDTELARLIGAEPVPGRFRRFAKPAAVLTVLAVLAVVAVLFIRSNRQEPAPAYQTAAVTRGDLVVTVSATGNLQPTNQVDVGSELSGTVDSVLVDINDRVKKGQVLARLDTSKLQDQIVRSRAALASAEAQVRQAGATVRESRATLERLQEVYRLSGGKVPSKTELENAEAALQRALAAETSAEAQVDEARAALSSDQTNLAKASIRSPIDGVVLGRQIEPGQTVAASLQAPVLFTLAEDLSQMELQVDVDEADVGKVSEGQAATFNVDAWAGRKYPARITRVGFGSQAKDGVVSYLTVLAVENDDLTLRPGMTATAEIVAAKREGVLLVPNAALRFSPQAQGATPQQAGGLVARMVPQPPGRGRAPQQPVKTTAEGSTQQIWILRNGQPTPIAVTVGATDGRNTEVTGDGVQPGLEVITDALEAQS